jgi:hypothetical protein
MHPRPSSRSRRRRNKHKVIFFFFFFFFFKRSPLSNPLSFSGDAESLRSELEQVKAKLADATRKLKKQKSARSDDAPTANNWFLIGDDEFQVPLDASVAKALEDAFLAKRWFTEVPVDERRYVKLFAAGDVRLFVRDDKDDLLGRIVERDAHPNEKRGSPYPSHFPPAAPAKVETEPVGVDAIPLQFRGLFAAAAPASSTHGSGMQMPPQLAAMMGGGKAGAAATSAGAPADVLEELEKERRLRIELEHELNKVQAERMAHTEKLVKDKMATKSQLAAERENAKKLAERVAQLERDLVAVTPRSNAAAATEVLSAASDEHSHDERSVSPPLPPPTPSSTTSATDTSDGRRLREELDAARAELEFMRARLEQQRSDARRTAANGDSTSTSTTASATPAASTTPAGAPPKAPDTATIGEPVPFVGESCHESDVLAEERRLVLSRTREKNWKRWGPYVAERQWGTVREDYSVNGDAWNHLSHDMARSVAYRWGEDGLLGVCDRECRLALSLALWNERDPILKERLFGLAGPEGNHGEDVKEEYFYLKSTPTHSYMLAKYKYPFGEFPYARLARENRERSRTQPEFELKDTGVFDNERYFDVDVEYAKADDNDLLVQFTVTNCSDTETAPLHLMPTLVYRNTWSWVRDADGHSHNAADRKPSSVPKPQLRAVSPSCVATSEHEKLEPFFLFIDHAEPAVVAKKVKDDDHHDDDDDDGEDDDSPLPPPSEGGVGAPGGGVRLLSLAECLVQPIELLFTDNDTNFERIGDANHVAPRPKDLFHTALCGKSKKERERAHKLATSEQSGTKCSVHCVLSLPPQSSTVLRLRLTRQSDAPADKTALFGAAFDQVVATRLREHDAFYARRVPGAVTADERHVALMAYAGLFWSKQFYMYIVDEWLNGDSAFPPPPAQRRDGRNHDWRHFYARDVIMMPDKWEYVWFAVWDLAFHCVAVAPVDADLAKEQLLLFLREWYMHPNGCLPAYEWKLEDVNPPVHAWAVWRVYRLTGSNDIEWLARAFQKLLLNFTWWVNRKDPDGKGLFSGGFLGLDNIGVFDRSAPLPTGGGLQQADGTAWMGVYCVTMLKMAIELARHDAVAYEDMASKFFEHFIGIADAMNSIGGDGLWDENDGFYYDKLRDIQYVPGVATHGAADGRDSLMTSVDRDDVERAHTTRALPMRIRSIVGIVPLFAAGTMTWATTEGLTGFHTRTAWFVKHRAELARVISVMDSSVTVEQQVPEVEQDHIASDKREQLLMLAIPSRDRAARLLEYVFDTNEFLSPFGVRSLSRFHLKRPYTLTVHGHTHSVAYAPGESDTAMFGGNSNWRGPVWAPMNYLIIESLERMHHFYGDTLQPVYPARTGKPRSLDDIAIDLSQRMVNLFLPAADGSGRPCMGGDKRFAQLPRWRDLVLFHEYFHGDTGAGLGATHQTGWTALVADCVRKVGTARMLAYRKAEWYYARATLASCQVLKLRSLSVGAYALRGGAPLVLTCVSAADAPLARRAHARRHAARGLAGVHDVSAACAADIAKGGWSRFVSGADYTAVLCETGGDDDKVLVHRAVSRRADGFTLWGVEQTFGTMQELLQHCVEAGEIDLAHVLPLDAKLLNKTMVRRQSEAQLNKKK